MNMLGKILVVLIFIMSVFFMAFSFMVFMTQTNWKENTATEKKKLDSATSANRTLQQEIATLKTGRASENAARTNAIALLEASLASSEQQKNDMQQELTALRAQQQQQGAQVTGSLATLQAEREKVDALRETVKAAQAERDKMFAEVVDLKNEVLELESVRQRLSSSETALLDQVSRQAAILRANDIGENEDISGVPPKRDGKVKEVDALNKYVALSLGSDDGLRVGHKLDVHRGPKYLSKVAVIKIYPDRAVAKVLDGYRKGAIRSGDSVRTK